MEAVGCEYVCTRYTIGGMGVALPSICPSSLIDQVSAGVDRVRAHNNYSVGVSGGVQPHRFEQDGLRNARKQIHNCPRSH
jgi:hypothetical protein